jgi:TIR domain/DisA bacterial checkpoint controller nucleotide-binding
VAKVFISYVREDESHARRLYDDLHAAGVDSWIDCEDLLPGEKWRDAIVNAIRQSQYFIVLLSSNSLNKRGFYQREVKMALEILDEQPPSSIYFIPVRLDPCIPTYGRLLDLQWLDLFSSYEDGFRKLLRVVRAVGEQVIANPVASSPVVAHPVPPSIVGPPEALTDVIASRSKDYDTPLVHWAGAVAFRLASQRRGALLTVGDHESVLKWGSLHRGELLWQKIDLSHVEAGSSCVEHDDGATVISIDGRVLKSPLFLHPPPGPRDALLAGLGSRHNVAIATSAITRALCIAVSVDGVVSAFLAGEYLARVKVKEENLQST